MAQKPQTDQFANYAIITCAESAANTLTFKKLETGISLSEKVAWVISRIEYILNLLSSTEFNSAGDTFSFGLSLSNSWTAPAITETTIVDFNTISRDDVGAAATGMYHRQPFIKDLSTLPGGGLLVPPVPLFLYGQGVGLNAAETVVARIHYNLLPLSVDQYWELVEARRVLSS